MTPDFPAPSYATDLLFNYSLKIKLKDGLKVA